MTNSTFSNVGSVSGGDGLDTSGSTLTISDSYFNEARDKAISAGENSHLTLNNITIENSNIALVSKDRSEVTAHDIRIDNIKEYALMSYTKKPIFGSANLNVTKIQCQPLSCVEKSLVELGSALSIDGVSVSSEEVNVKALYQGIMKSDKPK